MLKKRVVDVAVNEVNEKTDISVDYELERYGRRVTHIKFNMSTKTESLPSKEKQSKIRESLSKFGVKEEKIKHLLDHHDEQYLRANIKIVEEKVKTGKIRNVTAYLLKAFADDFRPLETEYDRNLKARVIANNKITKEKAKKDKEQQQLKNEFYNNRKLKLEELLNTFPKTKLEEEKNEFITEFTSSEVMMKLYKSKGFDNPIVQ